MDVILAAFDDALAHRHPSWPRPDASARANMLATPRRALLSYLGWLAEHAPHPLVLLLDGVDGAASARIGYAASSRRCSPAATRALEHRGKRIHVIGCSGAC
jgi:hypothetical protein